MERFHCNLNMGGAREIILQPGELYETLAGIFITSVEELGQCAPLEDADKSII